MARFQADFSVYPPQIFAPAKVTFTDKSTIGDAFNDEFTVAVDENGNILDLPEDEITGIKVSSIERLEWSFGDGSISSDKEPDHVFDYTGMYNVQLSVFSNEVYSNTNGVFYRLRNSVTKVLDVGSMATSWLRQHMTTPHVNAYDSSGGFKDLVDASSKMFDRMYKDLSEALTLIDIRNVAPRFLEFFSDTIGHKRGYAEKVGYKNQLENEFYDTFLDYSIFDRITEGKASEEEINLFRQFISDTAKLFKMNGSEEALEDFFKLYGFVIDIKEMWTTGFGENAETITDSFFDDPTLKSTLSKFEYNGISVSGFENERGHLDSNISNLIIDNYHYTSKHVFPSDAYVNDAENCVSKYFINEYTPRVLKVIRDDGRKIADKLPCSNFSPSAECLEESNDYSCIDTGINIEKNTEWDGLGRVKFGVNTKYWRAADGYVTSVNNVVGPLPASEDEADEFPFDFSDDYLWADWDNGVVVPDGVTGTGVNSLRRPSFQNILPNINLSNSIEDASLLRDEPKINSKRDLFVVSRGFIHVETEGYYVFYNELGNPGTNSTDNHVSLFSIKHGTAYTREELDEFDSLSQINFVRAPGNVSYTVTDNDTLKEIYGTNSEYGVSEIRQDEVEDDRYHPDLQPGGYHYLVPGYYAFELKSTYNSIKNKKFKLSWEVWNEVERPSATYFEPVINRSLIPTHAFLTFDESETTIEDQTGKGILTVPYSQLEGGDSFKVIYVNDEPEDNIMSGFMSGVDPIKDSEITVRLSPEDISISEETINSLHPRNRFGVMFRAINAGKDLYTDVDTYYAFIMNGSKGEYGLAQVTYNKEIDDVYFRYLNLNSDESDLDKRVFFESITDSYNHPVSMKAGTFYDIKIRIEDNKVSVQYRENSEFTHAVVNIQKALATDLSTYDSAADEWMTLLSDVDLMQDDIQTGTFDTSYNDLEIADKYVPINEAGRYGLFTINSSFKINRYIVEPLDVTAQTRKETLDKWKEDKPKYLDGKGFDTLHYNSYGATGTDKPVSPTFKYTMIDSYAGENSVTLPSYLGNINDNEINSLYLNNVSGQDSGSRFNIYVDSEYINSVFKTTEEAIESMTVPVGHFYEPYVEWTQYPSNTEHDKQYSSIPLAGYNRYMSDSARVLPHTVALSAGDDTSTLDFISYLERDEDDISKLTLDGHLNTLLVSTNDSEYGGVWEEVMPHSSESEFCVPTLGTVENELFDIITKGDSKIGVHIKSEKASEMLQCRYCDGSIVWGLYDIILPTTALIKDQNLYTLTLPQLHQLTLEGLNSLKVVCMENELPTDLACGETPIREGRIVRYFVPIGKIDGESVDFLPPAELLVNDNIEFNLLGVYSHIGTDQLTIQPNNVNVQLTIDGITEIEKKYKSKVKSEYYLDVTTPFIGSVTKYNDVRAYKNVSEQCNPGEYLYRNSEDKVDENGCSEFIPNLFHMPDNIVNVYEHLEEMYPVQENNVVDSTYVTEYEWWTPDDIWFKRDISVIYPDGDTSEHLNTGFSDIGGTFYGDVINTAGVEMALTDSYPANIGPNILIGEWCVNSVGWDSDYFSVDGVDVDANLIEIGVKMQAPIPVQSVCTSGQDSLYFGTNYNNETIGKRTFTPVGLFNWYQTHSAGISGSDQVGWDVTDWNDEFKKCFEFKSVLGPAPKTMFEINKYWSFDSDVVPPVGSKVRAIFENRNCYGVDGEKSPKAVEEEIVLGVSDGHIGFYSVPTKVSNYIDWRRQLKTVLVDNYTLDTDMYYTSTNTVDGSSIINLRTDTFSFNKFTGSAFVLDFFYDQLFDNVEETFLSDNFAGTRDINWVTCVESNDYFIVAPRETDAELKYTSESLPYNIIEYQNSKVYQATNKFDIKSGSDVSGTELGEVGFGENRGFTEVLQLIDTESTDYSLSCDVIFDPAIMGSDYKKQFELIVKAESSFVVDKGQWGITNFYYVGVGTNGFDIGLSMRSVDQNTGVVSDTFLASFGDFNLRNIQSDMWYSLKVDVSEDSIKVFFNERSQNSQLVLNYNINKKYEKLTDRYLNGEFETLQSIIIGLEELGVTYPNTLGNKVSDEYTFENFKEEFASTLPINGLFTGFRVFNPLTYVTNVQFIPRRPKIYKFGSTFNSTEYAEILYKIEKRFGLPDNPEIKAVDIGLDGTLFIQINDMLFHQLGTGEPEKYPKDIVTIKSVHDKIIIVEKQYPDDGAVGINNWSVGDHTFIWSLVEGENTYNVTTYKGLIQTIPNADRVEVVRTLSCGTTETYEVITTGTSASPSGDDVTILPEDEVTVTIGCSRDITWPLNGTLARYNKFVRVYHEGFEQEYPVLIKDKTFYKDSLGKYMKFADKFISDVHINDSKLNIIFEDN